MSGSADLSDLPDDVAAEIAPHVEAPLTVLAAIGATLAAKREEAKAARTQSGIEAIWAEAEEAYLGMDDANRHEFAEGRMEKPTSIDGPLTSGRIKMTGNTRSTVFLRLTSRYVDAGAAKLGEILLPPDDKSFSFAEMPVPELTEASKDESQVVHSDLGVPLTRPLAKGEAAPAAAPPPTPPAPAAPPAPPAAAGQPGVAPPGTGAAQPPSPAGGAPAAAGAGTPAAGAPPRVPLTVKDLAVENIELARKRAKAAETRVYNWMVETKYRAEFRKVFSDGAKLGVGVIKGPIPEKKRVMAVTTGENGDIKLVIKDSIIPACKWVAPQNIFPDPACGENIQDGDHLFERDFMSPRQVRGLKKLPGYIASQIDLVLEEGPQKANVNAGPGRTKKKQKGRYEVWYYYGALTKEEMTVINQAAGKPAMTASGDDTEEVNVIVTLINDCPVRASVNPLDSGGLPYHAMPWSRRADHWAGVGVAEQIKAAQRITNASLRALLNNAGKSAGSQFVIDRAGIEPADDSWQVTPDKIWYKTADGPQDVRQAFMAVQIPNVTEQMMSIVTMGERFAEESTSIPLITQGQSGATTPDTFGAAQLQNNNANQLLRSIGYNFDDYITEPLVRMYYEWLLLDPNVPNEEKAEFQIDAHGSAALVERAIQDQTIGQMGGMAANPIYGINPKKWTKIFLKSKRLNPDDVQYTEEEQAKIDATPPPEAPAVTVAKIGQDTAMKQLAAKQTTEQQSQQSEERIAAAANTLEGGHVQNDAARVQAEQQRTQVEATVKLHELQTRHDLALMEYANKMHISLAQAKVDLARTAMQLQTQRDLNAADNAIDLHKHRTQQPRQPRGPKPPVQVPGRARNGQAFEQGAPA